jgi:hypothetical protein
MRRLPTCSVVIFPPTTLTRFRDQVTGATLDYIKYDAMIVACAVRHKANVIVSTDAGIRKLAERVGLECRAPSWFVAEQTKLFR